MRLRCVLRGLADHPLIVVAALAVVVGVANLVWVSVHRQPGGLDVDEVSYLSAAFRWHRFLDPADPLRVQAEVFQQDKGPLTMLVSVAALVIGPRTTTAAFAASAFFHGAAAVAVAGIVRRSAGSVPAVVAGTVALCLPTGIVAARSYQLAPSTAACLCAAMWCVLASDKGRARVVMLVLGLSIGCLLLSRTMAVAFVPGVVVATGLQIERSAIALRNATFAAAVAVIVAGPWWWSVRVPLIDYLLGYGYGAEAGAYGPQGLLARIGARMGQSAWAVGSGFALLAVVTIMLAGFGWRRSGHRIRWSSPRVAVWVPVILGFAALMSTSNQGLFFELPLLTLGVAAVVGLTPLLPPRSRTVLGSVALVLSVVTIGVSLGDSGGRGQRPLDAAGRQLFTGLEGYQPTTLEAEPALASPDNEVRRTAMRAWWDATEQIVVALDDVDPEGRAVQTVCGSGAQLSAGSITLAGEILGRREGAASEWLATTTDEEQMADMLAPTNGDRPRVVVLIELESVPFPTEQGPGRCARVAHQLGWHDAHTVDLPDGGTATVMKWESG